MRKGDRMTDIMMDLSETDRGGMRTPCAASRCAASSIRPSATTITGSAWREAYEPVSITTKELLNVTNTTPTR
jgi:hypothetical protein